jgi:hypothetical protein
MFGDLRKASDAELLNYVKLILSHNRVTTPFDYTELTQINDEFRRRELLAGVHTQPRNYASPTVYGRIAGGRRTSV